ncbi:hypothetical protein B1_02 [Acinetobacter phage vB_AbaP_B1]|uniref:Uncharacterized protein n=2 Tax=Friunavirus TaxID=1985711 RepID=A0A221SBD8_9CAUD|nr:hypothetical protein FDI30_gp02 [Acinetobacter phage vB_AbaP_B1]YP_009610389.1 hypothetical protein FDI32_gp03 [Acinetobacter phage vB_AbaP_B5]ASN73310.1 hypothetical protein B1_02 [Acinetobacter phage vB_AbaP_B1]ASN73411.1 hypothetical protein B5_03 [Acinetobacter phage vB_AbaP_B5]
MSKEIKLRKITKEDLVEGAVLYSSEEYLQRFPDSKKVNTVAIADPNMEDMFGKGEIYFKEKHAEGCRCYAFDYAIRWFLIEDK